MHNWPRLSETLTGPRDPGKCQSCGVEWDLTIWQECDERDKPEERFVVLCNECEEKLIEPHPRLYIEWTDNKPWPGIMRICRPCIHRYGLDCRCALQKRLGGPGMKVQSCEPMRGHMSFRDKNGRRTGKFFERYAMPPRDCEGRQTTEEKENSGA